MAEAVRADSGSSIRIGRDVVLDIVRTCGIAGQARQADYVIEAQEIADAPGEIVVGARVIAGDAASTDRDAPCAKEREAAADRTEAANPQSDHGILPRAHAF